MAVRFAMKKSTRPRIIVIALVLFAAAVFGQGPAPSRPSPAIRTPLPQDVLTLLANEVSGQFAFNNLVRLAGAPWVRDPREFSGTMEETQRMFDLVKGYGLETVNIERYPGTGTTDYPLEGEFWTLDPEKRLVARLGADAALIGRGSKTCDVTGDLIYVPSLPGEETKKMREAGPQDKYKGKLALVWGANADTLSALDAAGAVGLVTFSAQDRYLDPDQVLYAGGGVPNAKNISIVLTVSWRQWTELFELVQGGRKVVVRAKARVEKYPEKFEGIYAWIPGTEPDKKGVIFTGHLFEGWLKRGANDDMTGCVVELEILRALSHLIASKELPAPRRSLHFLWTNEISGTNEFIKRHPDLAAKWAVNINMDMVGESLRKNNSLLTMSECPSHLPSFFDGLAQAILNYVWRTNDIVYLNDGPRAIFRGQNFPVPMWEKNGTRDAFRFFIHRATGGSDHICFNNPAVGVPGIELFTWPDQWYHTDTDTPDKADATEMKRVAFIGAATGWAAAMCGDDVAPALGDAVVQYGYKRIAERELAAAMARIDAADGKTIGPATAQAMNLLRFAARREIGALRSIDEISTGSAAAKAAVARRIGQFEAYGQSLTEQARAYGLARAKALGADIGAALKPDPLRKKYDKIVPAIAPAVQGREFNVGRFEGYTKYLKDHPDALKAVTINPGQTSAVLNFVNGRNSVAEIRDNASAELDADLPLIGVAAYIELLAAAGYLKI
jgi:aminopeptidase YwaD